MFVNFINLFFPSFSQILHSHIASVEKLPLNAAGSPLKIRCKTFQIVTFIISRDRDSQEIYSCLLQLSNPGDLQMTCSYQESPVQQTEL